MLKTKRLMIVLLALSGGLVLTGCANVQAPYELAAAIDFDNLNKVKSIVEENPKLVNSALPRYFALSQMDQGILSTPLHYAVYGGHKDIVELLITKGANVSAKDNEGATPLHKAAAKGYKDIAELLVNKGADINAKDKNGSTPLWWAVYYDKEDMAELLITKGADISAKDKNGMIPLDWTINNDKKDMAELLIDKGADVNAKGVMGETPLHRALIKGTKT
jgi:ankyrin repeat protein